MPDIHFTKVRIFNKEYNIHEFEKKDSNSLVFGDSASKIRENKIDGQELGQF